MKEKALPEGWKIRLLEDLADILDAKRIPVNNEEREARIAGKSLDKLYPYFGATGEVGKIDGYLFDEELIALGEDGVPFFDSKKNKAYLLTGKTWVNNHAHVLRAKDNIAVNQYLLYYLNQFDYQGYVNGATRLKLTQANMRKIPVITAPFEQQQKLAKKFTALLSQVAEIKQRLDKIPALLKTYRQSVLARAVNGELSAKWREENGVSLDSWNKAKINNLGSIFSGKTPSKKNPSYWENGTVYWVSAKDMKFDEITFSSDLITEKAVNETKLKICPTDTILMVMRSGIIAHTFPVALTKVEVTINQDLKALRPKKDFVQPKFIFYLLKGNEQKILEKCSKAGTTVASIEMPEFEKFVFDIPSLEEQNYITQAVEKHLNFANQLEAQVNAALERVNLMTQAILAKGFRGELL
ncbi:restriction endonuclease subunit S [Glaesserella parasuis]|uniref:restriction endonuclease subunit S n=1 Tax=Glaesserella parasuis TaxID=738 RepID=UPI0021C1074D|nr:restriction endonuclease subunit S [Glaesserella parasuis]MCT8607711.1 restriction endonuclease subunit S [Glaesserella parasuis]MDE4001819.1 restriction endonuclease subunit S [Glaesserella parasuis]MDE4021736.1 restriction endonuclease subunit S [Glaesserella parasuis]MDG6341147.1 restriction endonuclease subunit S [Glaesserella parasuis]MDG6367202.1 restriction endonuclease subunit S [Glaesserella parasuis]